ncbi:MAG TPA: winged helix-turn-helix domain-containing protein [Chloroflexaceae bacterium]|nr:winged helix-turn-helix domain-containing protein [Chloroflexaceae bacterium]
MSSIGDRDAPLSLEFRSELLARLMADLGAGECVSVIGGSGAGKTNLLRFLCRLDVQAAYWGQPTPWVVAIDTNALAFDKARDDYALLELIIHRLIRECERRGLPTDLRADFDRLHAGLVAQPSLTLALRYLDRMCGRLCADRGIQLVFAFDQFEDVWAALQPRVFLNLRYLRDEYKYRLCYLVMTRRRLEAVREGARRDAAAVEAFWELFDAHVYGLGMYVRRDADEQLARIAGRLGVPLDPELAETARGLAGGHPALLRAVFWALSARPEVGRSPEAALAVPQIARECAKIWDDLGDEEQQALRLLAAGVGRVAPDPAALADLVAKELVVGEPPRPFAPLFAAYVGRDRSQDLAGVVVDPAARQVWVDGRRLDEPLSRLEFALLERLARSAGQVVRREEILGALYPDDANNTSDERLDTLLRRVREAIADDARNPRHLFTHRGVGVRLAQGRVAE